MASHDTHGALEHPEPGVRTYLVIFAALAGLTLVSVVANYLARHDQITAHTSFAIILSVAVVKAALVILYFMHLLMDWRKLYYLLIPAVILGAMMMFALMPDGVLAWHRWW